MKNNLKKHFLNKLEEFPDKPIQEKDYHKKKMADIKWKEFDKVWVRYDHDKATFNEWKKSLNKWLIAERI